MSKARLTAVTTERIKSANDATHVEFPLLTIILGRNNSGKKLTDPKLVVEANSC